MAKVLPWVVGLLAFIGAAYLAMLYSAFLGLPGQVSCTGYPLMEVPSPDAVYLATVKNESCSNGRGLQTIVELSGGNLDANTFDSVFVAPAATQEAGSFSPMRLKLTWQGASRLEIAYPHGVQPGSRVAQVGGATIVYRELAEP